MLIRHVYFQKKPIGTVVALDKDKIGWSQCCPLDHFNKKRGIEIAKGRAIKGYTKSKPRKYKDIKDIKLINFTNIYTDDIDIIRDACEEMQKRANKYYK